MVTNNTLREIEDYVPCTALADEFEQLCCETAATLLRISKEQLMVGSIHNSELVSLLRSHVAVRSFPQPVKVSRDSVEQNLALGVIGGDIEVVVDDDNTGLWFDKLALDRIHKFLAEVA